ncbi:hypothetical protein PoB_000151100 [Plakobranchus ocellatus]|uniref:Uncharacterized protein n=1 Tax=Plakobranchus ocellatus TaxID=259542 RepID=A0AAV3X269_9GAST|nr:hypothetical protein PoB_000151100 [Plakobranchus ocellatus]
MNGESGKPWATSVECRFPPGANSANVCSDLFQKEWEYRAPSPSGSVEKVYLASTYLPLPAPLHVYTQCMVPLILPILLYQM